ncbi:MAG TPA: FlgD immunoglobulin-like domain containing protein, partial [Vicinamibacteria bacterium]
MSFSWSLAAGPPRPIVVVVDPDGLAVESSKANNTARIDIAVQDSDFFVTNRYFSPNGDGVQDTTRLFYRLGAEELATVEVVDRSGRVVRRSVPVTAQASDFEWDGLDDRGRLARDGDYRLQVVRGAEVLGQALVTLDTDRSSLIEALGTPLELSSNLTCDVAYPGRPVMSGDERWVYFPVSFDPLYPDGIYRVSSLGGDVERISELVPWNDIVVAPDSSHIAFAAIRPVGNVYSYELWVANGDGKSPRVLRQQTSYLLYRALGFIENGRTLLAARESGPTFELEAIPLDGSDTRTILSGSIYSAGPYALSPRGTHLLMAASDGSGSSLRLVNLQTGTSVTLPWADQFAWSPDGVRFATAARSTGAVVIYDDAGNVRRNVSIPVEPIPSDLLPPDPGYDFEGLELSSFRSLSWSGSGTELAIIADYFTYQVTFGRLFRVEAVTGDIETIGWTEPQFNEGEGGGGESYHIYAWDRGNFVENGVLHYGLHYQEQEIALSLGDRDPSGEVRIRIRQTGREAAHVDAVALRSGGLDIPPVSAIRESDARDVLAEARAR